MSVRASKLVILLFGLALALALACVSPLAFAANETKASPLFALVVGVNKAPRSSVASLRYADDDAILFHEIFSRLGRSMLLVAPDAATARLYPSLARSGAPTRGELERAIAKLLAEVAASRARGESPRFVFVYSGHGDVKNGEGYLALADGSRLTGDDIEKLILARSRAVENHLVVDACRSYFLVRAKRAGGTREPLERGFHRRQSFLSRYPDTGVLLSTSSAASSHEWDALQAGVFSHEVRSGLLGAADADGDGRVTYDELSTFLVVANAAIPNQRFRPRFYARGPRARGEAALVDLRAFRGERLVIPRRAHGRYLLEDQRGVRLADVHSGSAARVVLRLPRSGTMFLRVAERGSESFAREHRIVARGEPRTLALPPATEAQYRPKGAAHEAFRRIFETPFSVAALTAYRGCLRRDARCGGKPCAPCPCATCTLWGDAPTITADADVTPAPLASLAFGTRVISRRLWVGDAGGYRFGPQLLLGAELAIFPMAHTRVKGLSWLGIVARYYHSVSLAGEADATVQLQGSSTGGRTQLFAFGFTARVPLGERFVLSWVGEFQGEHSEIAVGGPNLFWNWNALSPARIGLAVRLARFGELELAARAGAAYRVTFAANEIVEKIVGTDETTFGHAVAADAALLLSWRFVYGRLGGFFSYGATSLDGGRRLFDRRAGGELVVGVRY
ncbi:MAG: caspase family protein [Myxococcales bacterium]|nr:caspase family protein [Myxococcales bacterium]